LNLEIPCKGLVSQIFEVLSSEARLKSLELFGQGKELSEIAKNIGLSRSGFQKVVDTFRELGIIEPSGHRSYYKLSSKGEKLLHILVDLGNQIEPIEKEIAKEKIKTVAYGSGLTRKEIAEILQELGKTG